MSATTFGAKSEAHPGGFRDCDAIDATLMIATHNRVGELRKTLASLRLQRGVDFEIIVVDDASSDGTAEVVGREFPHVTLVRFDVNRGSIAARNEVLRRASGEIIVGLDDDSRFIEPDALTAWSSGCGRSRTWACSVFSPSARNIPSE